MSSKVAVIFGASRGIGREIALTYAKAGIRVSLAAKTVEDNPKLPGTIFSVAKEIQNITGRDDICIPIQCDVRDESQINNVFSKTLEVFGRIDVVVYNSGSIIWEKVINTPVKRFDLLQSVNIRGSYIAVQNALPHFLKQKSGHIIMISPPIYSRFFKGKTPYAVGKIGMSVLVKGLANELQGTGVAINALWPATAIESQVTEKMKVESKLMRKATIFADACLEIAKDDPSKLNGETLVDEDYLRSKGVTSFEKYRCSPNEEPPRMLPKKFPSLLVEEEAESVLNLKSKL